MPVFLQTAAKSFFEWGVLHFRQFIKKYLPINDLESRAKIYNKYCFSFGYTVGHFIITK